MLAWSLKLFRVRGIQLAVHSSFFLLLAYVAWQGWQPDPKEPGTGGWIGVIWNVAIVVVFFVCVVLHELGHSFMAMRFGVGVRRILLMPIGGMAEFDSIPREPTREFLITLAGPAVNFVLALGLWLLVRRLPDEIPMISYGAFADQLLGANLVMGCFNLIPAFPMDGGRIFRAMLASRMPYLRATRIAATVGKVICMVAMVAALESKAIAAYVFGVDFPTLWLVAALFAFIFIAGELEYRAAERRERDDAHWREMLARFYGPQHPADDPPLLSP